MSYPGIRQAGIQEQVAERIGAFSEESARKWGKMNHSQVLPHLNDGLRGMMKGFKTPPSGPFQFPPLRYLLLHVMKWPEGKVEAPPGAFETETAGLEEDRAALLGLLDEYMKTDPETLAKTHPAFGRMKPRDWDVLVYRHLDHHLRQFSC